jgi:replication factor C small subunit
MTDNLTLLEKYQPGALRDVYGHNTIRQILMSMVEQKNIPHLMFTGSPGNGKSTTAMALIKDLYGNDYKSNHVKFDASTERGIDVVRGKIKELTKYKSMNYPFKIILLEESDELTPNAQFALREIMLENQKITRFIFVNNNLNKIIAPIQDRCQIFRFASLQTSDVLDHLKLIVKEEGITITSTQIHTIADLADGSMRNAVNALQTISTQNAITDDLIKTVMGGKFSSIDAEKIIKAIYDNNQGLYEAMIFDLIYKDGFTPEDVMHGIIDTLIYKNDPKLIKQITLLAEYDFRMSQGQNKLLQLRCGLARLSSMKR